MIGRMRGFWEEFKEDQPGQRFVHRYERNQERARGRFDVRRLLNIVGGTLIVIVSVLLGWAPGPGWLTFFIGLGMIAGEFRPVAVFLDWAEVRARKLWRIAQAVWSAASTGERALIVLALGAAIVGLISLVVFLL